VGNVDASRLTDVFRFRDPPPEVVADFRAVDPRAEWVYIGRGKWWFGLVYPSIPLIQWGRRELIAIKESGGATWPALRLSTLKASGWRRIVLWDIDPKTNDWISLERFPHEPPWRLLLERFRLQDYLYRHHPNTDAAWMRLYLRHELGHTDEKLQQAVKRTLEVVRDERRSGLIARLRGRKVFGWRPRLAT
jgi:hypothetical protein